MITLRSWLVSFVLVGCPLPGQTTWTVDAAGGAQFTTILAAVTAASHGDTILVAPSATYSVDFTMSKGLAIVGLGAAPCAVDGRLTIGNLPAGRSATLRNLTYSGPGLGFQLALTNCAGTVHGEALQFTGYRFVGGFITSHPTIVAQSAACLTLHRCSALGWPAVDATNSALAISESQLTGISNDVATSAPYPAPAIRAAGSTIALTSCLLRGGNGHIHYQMDGADAVACTASDVLAAATDFVGGSVPYPPFVRGHSIALDAASSLVHDPACTFPDGIVGTGTVSQSDMCRLNGALPAPGSTTNLTTTGPAGVVAIVVAGLPAVPTDPLSLGLVWLDLSAPIVLQCGALPLPPIVVSAPIGTPHGVVFALQTALFAAGPVQLSPPLVTIVP